jgi:hypothetical protein
MPRNRVSGRWRLSVPIAGLLVLGVVGGCGGGSGGGSNALGPVPTTHLQPVSPGGKQGPEVTVPTEGGVRPISPVVDSGQQILVLAGQVNPRILIANSKQNVTWTNLTTSAQTVTFEQQQVSSGAIRPGGKWSYFPATGASIHYQTSTGAQGTIDFNPEP